MEVSNMRLSAVEFRNLVNQLTLRQGQIVKAVVQEVLDGKVVLNINGKEIIASGDLALLKGQLISLKVEQMLDQQILLKIMNSEQGRSEKKQGLDQLLTIKTQDLPESIAGKIDPKLPIGEQNKLPQASREFMQGEIKEIKGKNIVVTIDGQEITLKGEAKAQVGNTILLEVLKAKGDPAQTQKANQMINQENSQTAKANLATQTESNASVRGEANLFSRVEQGLAQKPEETAALPKTRIETGQVQFRVVAELTEKIPTAKLGNISAALGVLNKLDLKVNEDNLKVTMKLMENNLPLEKEVIQDLVKELKLLPKAEQANFLEVKTWVKTTNINETRETIRVLQEFLAGKSEPENVARALNLINQAEPKQVTHPFFNSFWWQNDWFQGEVYFWSKGKKGDQGAKFYKIVLHFQSKNLGDIWVSLTNYSDQLNIQMKTENELGMRLLEDNSASFLEILGQSGFTINEVSYAMEKPESVLSFMDKNEEKMSYSNINIRV